MCVLHKAIVLVVLTEAYWIVCAELELTAHHTLLWHSNKHIYDFIVREAALAQILVHRASLLWAFWILCPVQIIRLQQNDSCPKCETLKIHGHSPESPTMDAWLESFSVHILKTIRFLLQDEIKLFGPLSAVLPLQVATSFLLSGEMSRLQEKLYEGVMDTIRKKGYGDILLNTEPVTNADQIEWQ